MDDRANHAERSNTDWFKQVRWGVFSHYLADSASASVAPQIDVDTWNRRVERFDVTGLAEQLAQLGAGYYGITLGQNSGYYCAPNMTYDRYVNIHPSKLSRRDLIADLHAALQPKGIKLLVYLPAGAPENDAAATTALQWRKGPYRNAAFQQKWEAVIREWSERWSTGVAGWWIDGVYWPDALYRHPKPPNYASFMAALKAGNPDSLVAFNSGALVAHQQRSKHVREGVMPGSGADYTAGELDMALPVAGRWYDGTSVWPGRFVDGEQFHFLSFLGEWWGQGAPRFPNELVIGYTKHVNAHDGVVTWDVPIVDTGVIPQPFVQQLCALRDGLR